MLTELDTIPPRELLNSARNNAEKLEQNLNVLLEMAEMESGFQRVRLTDLDLDAFVSRLEKGRIPAKTRSFKRVLADPRRLFRAIEILKVASKLYGISLQPVEVRDDRLIFRFVDNGLEPRVLEKLDAEIEEARIVAEAGLSTSGSAFGDLLLSDGFLSRTQEGLGAEWKVIANLLKLQHGMLEMSPDRMGIEFVLRPCRGVDSLKRVFSGRLENALDEGRAVSAVLVRGLGVGVTTQKIREALFRASDAVVELDDAKTAALILEDCSSIHLGGLMGRLHQSLGQKLDFTSVSAPEQGTMADQLVERLLLSN